MGTKLKVTPVKAEVLRYFVDSENGPDRYMVDMTHNEGNGACACPDFQIVRANNIKLMKPLYSKECRCKHCIAAADDFRDRALRFFSNVLSDSKQKHMHEEIITLLSNII